ncbi:hypothetical protein Pcinc_005690 [Petrolisthes cinctipes]|uniref:Uncharacterized protein n=1 Tax=Petrolisthes cinctipes TaxID=88211 RepID=A0AAE1GCW2_PETCI|nr:hypothetical protein Pcinc_005690 [Petrolisthes cinctipes]
MSPAPSVVPVNKSRDENQELDNAVPTVDGGLCPCGGLCGMLIELTINDAFQPSVLILHQSFVPSAACTEKPLLERLEHVSVPSTNEGMSLCKSPETLAPSVASVNRSLEENQEPNYVVPTVDDVPHLLKLVRNNFLDHGFKLNESNITSTSVQELINRNVKDLKTSYKLSP